MAHAMLKAKMGPVVLEFNYPQLADFWSIIGKEEVKNPLDLIMLTEYHGDLNEECVGKEFDFDLKKLYR